MSTEMTPDQLQWVLDHNLEIRAGHRVQIADAVEAWRAATARVEQLEAALRFVECGGEAGGCPACGCGPYDGSPWHRNGCELATALGLPTVTP